MSGKIPPILDRHLDTIATMAIAGAVITIDAMGCQRNISKKIIAKKADYVIALNDGEFQVDV